MKQITKQLKQDIQSLESIEERLHHLKDKYKGETVYILTCGPSLGKHDVQKLNEKLKDKLVFGIKQSYNVVNDVADFHLVSTYNLSPYKWNPDSIVFWQFSKSYLDGQLKKAIDLQAPIDLFIPVINPPYIDRTQTTQATENFDNFYMLETHTESMWGCGMMYETAIPLALLLGCKKIVTIGWDLGDPNKQHTHFDDDVVSRDCYPQDGEIAETLKSTIALENWFEQKGIDFEILSDQSFINQNFKRITIDDI
tara:strand:- start:1153 stop:1911 length:759 start_codon:yes stop_codon:yes gene_type:complete